ncbi:MAG: glycine zipper 2TM domain-containing protein [Verrucomicrobia bacterium]|nr:glycine zipper 2TM domain-containing protein [Verrucomicrobiota bacterium]
MKMKFLLGVPVAMLFASCAQDTMTGDVYQQRDTRQAQAVNAGRITSIRPVKIEGNHTAGTVIGGVAGGLLGSNIGHGRSANTAGAVGGALVGGAVGSHAQQAMGSRNGLDITVRLDKGDSVSVVQQVNPREDFRVGDRVRVLSSNDSTRVSH